MITLSCCVGTECNKVMKEMKFDLPKFIDSENGSAVSDTDIRVS